MSEAWGLPPGLHLNSVLHTETLGLLGREHGEVDEQLGIGVVPDVGLLALIDDNLATTKGTTGGAGTLEVSELVDRHLGIERGAHVDAKPVGVEAVHARTLRRHDELLRLPVGQREAVDVTGGEARTALPKLHHAAVGVELVDVGGFVCPVKVANGFICRHKDSGVGPHGVRLVLDPDSKIGALGNNQIVPAILALEEVSPEKHGADDSTVCNERLNSLH